MGYGEVSTSQWWQPSCELGFPMGTGESEAPMQPEYRKWTPTATTVDERRQETRFPKEPDIDTATVRGRNGREMLAGVHDESLHGICLVMTDVTGFQVGATAVIVYRSDVLSGVVRHISLRPDGTYLVGFECR